MPATSVRRVLAQSTLVLTLVGAVLGLLTVLAIVRLSQSISLEQEGDRLRQAAYEMEINALEMVVATRDLQLTGHSSAQERVTDSISDFNHFSELFRRSSSRSRASSQLVRLHHNLERFFEELRKACEQVRGNPDRASSASVRVSELVGYIDNILDVEVDEALDQLEAETVRQRHITRLLLWLAVAGGLGTIAIGILGLRAFLYGSLMEPLEDLVNATAKLGTKAGIKHRVPQGQSLSELDALSRQINAVLDELERSTIDIDSYKKAEQDLQMRTAALLEEVSARQVSEQRLAAASNLWRQTFDAIDFPVLAVGRDLRIRRANKAAADCADREPVELVGTVLPDLEEVAPFGLLTEISRDCIKEGRSIRSSKTAEERFWLLQAILQHHENEVSVVLVAQDVSELMVLRQEVRQHQIWATLGQLTGGLAHEVRNPLFSMTTTLEALELDPRAKPFEEDVEALHESVRRLERLMQDLLTLGRPQADNRAVQPVAPCVERVRRACASEAQNRGVELKISCPEDLEAHIDFERFSIALENILRNAIQHSPLDSEVSLQIRAKGAAIQIEVADQGPGFRGIDPVSIFEPFITRRRGGIGLGLAIVKRIIEDDHAGSIVAGNRSDLDHGALFSINLPRTTPR